MATTKRIRRLRATAGRRRRIPHGAYRITPVLGRADQKRNVNPVSPPAGGQRLRKDHFERICSSRLLKKRVRVIDLVTASRRRLSLRDFDRLWLPSTGAARGPAMRASCCLLREVSDAYQVVDRQAEDEHPADTSSAAVPRLPHQSDGL